MYASNWTFSQEFYPRFQSSCSDLGARLEAAKTAGVSSPDELQAFTIAIAKLAKELVDATGHLPSHEQRQCELQVHTLEKSLEELRHASKPKSRFAFKRKPPASPKAPLSVPVEGQPPILPVLPADTFIVNVPSANLALSSHKRQYLTPGSLPASALSSHESDLTISDLDYCVVNFLPDTPHQTSSRDRLDISALHIHNLTNSILLFPAIKGSALIYNVSRCIIVVGCRQYRMHNSSNVDVYLSVSSNPVIEHSSGIRFAPYPSELSSPADGLQDSNLAVQDFSHIRATPSPNWSLIGVGNSVQWPTAAVTDEAELEEVLERCISDQDHDL